MEAEKKKKHARPRLGTLPFATLWSGAYALGWAIPLGLVIAIAMTIPTFIELFPEIMLTVGFIAIPGLTISLAQHVLIRLRTGQAIRNWWWVSSLGWLLGGVVFHLMTMFSLPIVYRLGLELLVMGIIFGMIFLPPVVLQAFLLRYRVQKVWMWPLAALVSGSLFILPTLTSPGIDGVSGTLMTFGFGGLLQGLVMGLTLLWLFGMSQSNSSNTAMTQGAQDAMSEYGALTASTGEKGQWVDVDAEDALIRRRTLRQQVRR